MSLPCSVALEVGQSFVACTLVQAGAGVALVNELVLSGQMFSDLVVRPLHPRQVIEMTVLTPIQRQPSMLCRAFVDSLDSATDARGGFVSGVAARHALS